MSDEDMIRRGDAIAKIKKAASGKSSSGLVLTVDAGVEALREIPAARPQPDVAALVEALEALIQQTYDCEKELTEVLHHIDFCGESEPLAKARAAIARVKGGEA